MQMRCSSNLTIRKLHAEHNERAHNKHPVERKVED